MWKVFEQLLKEKNVTAYEVAKACGFSQSILSRWKSGKYIPKTDKMQKIADYFGVPLEYLLTGVQKDVHETGYYLNPETAKVAQEMFENGCKVVVFDSPQLFEAGQDADCDRTVAVLADKALRLERIMARDKISEQAALLRMSAQPDDDFYRQRADVIWENNGDAETLRQTAKEWLSWL